MRTALVAVVVAAVIVLWFLFRFHRMLVTTWFLVRLWRFMTGEAHHGKPITDRGWFRPGQRALTPTGHATRWRHLPRIQATAHRTGGVLGVTLAAWGFLVDPLATAAACSALLAAAAVHAGWRAVRWQRRRKEKRTWLHPLHLRVHELAGIPRAQLASSWISVETARDTSVKSARLELPPGFPADAKDRELLVSRAATALGIEAPDTTGSKWSGPSPVLVLAHSEPPPSMVSWDDVAEAVTAAHANELICGIGKKGVVTKASLSLDSPHFGINMGSGGGKSNLAAFWLMQQLHNGAIAMVLDAKWNSHPWLIKDDEGEYDQLPNIAYLSSAAELHAGMCWLGRELDRRMQVTRRGVTASGSVKADIGPRLIVLAEELNLAMPLLRQYWAEVRDPSDVKKSPALTGFGSISFAGRALKCHAWLVGQMVTAEVTGSKDSSVKQSVGVWAMSRYGAAAWKTAVGDVPMPPVPSVVGRMQLAIGRNVTETQPPLVDMSFARQYAVSGQVALCPAGMPGAVTASRVHALHGGPDQSFVPVTNPMPAAAGGHPVTLKEAAELRLVHPRTTFAALKMARFRDPEFPAEAGMRGTAKVYDPAALAAWDQARRA